MIEVENTDVNIVRNLIPMRNHMPASACGLKAISDWLKTYSYVSSKRFHLSKGPSAAKTWGPISYLS